MSSVSTPSPLGLSLAFSPLLICPYSLAVTRAVIDVSNHQYPLFVSLDKHFHAAIEKDAAKLPRILLQRRFFELRHLNELIDFLRTHFVFLAEILAVYDHPYNRRKTKLDKEAARQIRTAKFAVSENARAAILKYLEDKGTDGARMFPRSFPFTLSVTSSATDPFINHDF